MTEHALRGRTRYPGTIDSKLLPAWSPAMIDSISCWIDFTDGNSLFVDDGINKAINNGDLIYRASDKSGMGRHFYQTTEARRPLYRPAIGLGAAEFDGIDDILQSSSLFFTNTGTIIAVIRLSSTSEKGAIAGAGIKDAGWHFGIGKDSFDNTGNDFIVLYSTVKWGDSNDALGTGNTLMTLKMDNYAATCYIKGIQNHTISASTALPSTCMTIGGEGANRYFTDHIYEVVYFSSALSDANRALVENYLMAKHGIV